MGLYDDQILPRVINALCRGVDPLRPRATEGLAGEVLEVGFGSGRNVPHYPVAVKRVLAVEPAAAGRKLGAKRIAASPVPIEYVGLDGQDLALDDHTVDHVLVTWTLCTIPDVHRALTEMRRVLRPGGQLHFLEHGLSPRPKVAAWQSRADKTWGKVFGGCHLNRPIPDLITGAGFVTTRLSAFTVPGPRFASQMYEGTARADA